MFWLCGGQVAEMEQCPFNVPGHGQVNSTVLIIPSNSETAVSCGCPIFTDLVVLLEGTHEVNGVLSVGVFDSKIIFHKGKCNWVHVVPPQAGSDGTWYVPMGCKELLQLPIGQEAGLGETVHAALNLHVDMSFVDQGV